MEILYQRIARLETGIHDRANQLATLTQQMSQRDGQIAHLTQQMAEQDGQIAQLTQQVAERDGLLLNIIGSRSWQATHPLRVAVHQWKRARHVLSVLPTIISESGGLVNTVEKAITAFRRDGFSGIRNRLRRKIIGSGVVAVQPCKPSDLDFIDRNDYSEWIRRYDTMDEVSRSEMKECVKTMTYFPLISIIMPTYNPGPEWLIEAIESVRKQIYPHWELCIADDASTDEAIRPILENYANKEPRIKVVFREKNGHISAASNDALRQVTGQWVALLDNDDLLAEHALYWVAQAINQNPNVRLIYSDEDKIDEKGRRFNPYFKCDWNVDLFYSHNLVSHLGVYSVDLVQQLGGFREGLEGSQDYDLALRMIEKIEPHQVHHIPRVLYHWRVHEESTAQSAEAKPYAMLAGERALNEHFVRQGVDATVELIGYGYRVRYALPESPPLATLIIPTKNGLHLIRPCVDSILSKTIYPNFEILIVDNGSDDQGTLRYLQSLEPDSRVRVLRDTGPFNFSAINNAAVKEARGTVVGLINNDVTVISPEWLSEMISLALQPQVGAVGARLWYPNDTLQHGGVILGNDLLALNAHKGYPRGFHGYFGRMSLISGFSAVTGACMIIQKSIYEELGRLNESDLQVAYNDIDLCLRAREAGYRNVWTPYAELYHHESASRGVDDLPEHVDRFAQEVRYMKQRWKNWLSHDPAYSPNLTLNSDDFSLAWPPRIDQLAVNPSSCLEELPWIRYPSE